jgi:hypothetical protein
MSEYTGKQKDACLLGVLACLHSAGKVSWNNLINRHLGRNSVCSAKFGLIISGARLLHCSVQYSSEEGVGKLFQ